MVASCRLERGLGRSLDVPKVDIARAVLRRQSQQDVWVWYPCGISCYGFYLPVVAYVEHFLVESATKLSRQSFTNVLMYSLAFSFADRLSSGLARAVAEPATSRVTRVRNCMIVDLTLRSGKKV